METNRRDFIKMGSIARMGIVGMDFIMLNDFFDASRNKKQVPLNAYDAAAWSAVSALSEMSVARGGSIVDFPDFTRGQWIKREPSFAKDTQFPIDPSHDLVNTIFKITINQLFN
jgi:hypothetical protein